jgi:hypothetical protein
MLNMHIDIFNLSASRPEEPINVGKREMDGRTSSRAPMTIQFWNAEIRQQIGEPLRSHDD